MMNDKHSRLAIAKQRNEPQIYADEHR